MHGSIDYELWLKQNRFSVVQLFKNAARAGKLFSLINHVTISLPESFCGVRIWEEDLM